jgi:hypothetical protein
LTSNTEVLSLRGKLAAKERFYPGSDHSSLQRELKAANLAAYVERVVSEAPPLTPEQLDRVAGLLRGSAA